MSKHHPSCSESDISLVWHCYQCGLNESAADLEITLDAQRERCDVCNSELSQCAVQGVDGEPSLDCLVCKLREQLAAQRERYALLKADAAKGFQLRIKAELEIKALTDELENMIAIARARYCGHCDLGYKDDECTCGNYDNALMNAKEGK